MCNSHELPPGYRAIQGEGGKGFAFAYGNSFPHSVYYAEELTNV